MKRSDGIQLWQLNSPINFVKKMVEEHRAHSEVKFYKKYLILHVMVNPMNIIVLFLNLYLWNSKEPHRKLSGWRVSLRVIFVYSSALSESSLDIYISRYEFDHLIYI